MGATPADTAAMPQALLVVHPTRTVYTFVDKRVRITLTFLTPALPWDLELLSRPITYLSWDIVSVDGKPHQVQLYVDCGAEIAVNIPDQSVGLEYPVVDGLSVARMGTGDQPVLARRGDDVRIDWGYGYLATPAAPGVVVSGGNGGRLRRAFVTGTALPTPAGPAAPTTVTESRLAMAASWDLGTVGTTPVTRWAMLAYDDVKAIRYFARDLSATGAQRPVDGAVARDRGARNATAWPPRPARSTRSWWAT